MTENYEVTRFERDGSNDTERLETDVRDPADGSVYTVAFHVSEGAAEFRHIDMPSEHRDLFDYRLNSGTLGIAHRVVDVAVDYLIEEELDSEDVIVEPII